MTGRSATGRGHQLWLSTRRFHWRNSPHHEGSFVASIEGAVVGNEVEVDHSSSRRWDSIPDLKSEIREQVDKLSNKPLQRTWAFQLSVEGQRAGAARLGR